MKKLLAVFMAVLMLTGSFGLFANAQETELKISVANDLHLNTQQTGVTLENLDSFASGEFEFAEREDFSTASTSGHLYKESFAIISKLVEEIIAGDSDVVLFPGDLADRGVELEHRVMALMFAEIEKAGKKVFVVPGNHDHFSTTPAQFAEYYAAFGYDEAIAREENSASYVAELSGDYRLLAVDSTDPGMSPNGVTVETVKWIEAQAQKAKEDGKKLIAMMHHNLLEHYILSETIHKGAVINSDFGLKDIFAQYGVKYIFTGHTHNHDIKAYTDKEGNTIYDVVTSALVSYNSPYRVVSFGEKVTFETKRIERINTSLLPKDSKYTESEMELISTDFHAYAKEVAYGGLYKLAASYLTPSMLKSLLKLEGEENAEMAAIIDKVGSKLSESVKMPLYIKDEAEEGKSIEALIKAYETTLPSSEYKDVLELAINLYQAQVLGDENYPAYSPEVIILTRGLAAIINYTLADVSDRDYAQVLSFVTELLGFGIPVDFLVYAGSGIKRFEGAEILVTTAIIPVLLGFTTDSEPADNNVTLPGYDFIKEPEKSFFEKILAFFMSIIETLKSLLALLPGVEF